LRRDWNGTAWMTMTTGLTANELLNKVWGTGDTDLWAGGNTGIWRWDGTKWSKDPSAPVQNKNIQHVFGTSKTDVWAATSNELFHYDGTAWTLAAADNGVTPTSISNLGGGAGPEVWLTTSSANGRFYRYAGGACSPKCWTQVDVPGINATFRSVWGAANNDLWAVGNSGLVAHYDGQTWARTPYSRAPLTTTTLTSFLWRGQQPELGAADLWSGGYRVTIRTTTISFLRRDTRPPASRSTRPTDCRKTRSWWWAAAA
jgi:hypothetical protein